MTLSTNITGTALPLAILAALLGFLPATGAASAQSAASTLIGGWNGSGRIYYTEGSSEGILCTAYYTGGDSDLSIAIQCKSDRNPIHIRSKLRLSGGRASGDWEERTFNASGSVSGSVSASRMSLSITGGGFSGSMSVTFGKTSHKVTINTQGIAMRRATMSFRRR